MLLLCKLWRDFISLLSFAAWSLTRPWQCPAVPHKTAWMHAPAPLLLSKDAPGDQAQASHAEMDGSIPIACQGSSLNHTGQSCIPSPSASACCLSCGACPLLPLLGMAVLHNMTMRHLPTRETVRAWPQPSVCQHLIGTTGLWMLIRFLVSITQKKSWGQSGHSSNQRHKECYMSQTWGFG